ncbi:MAG TPA: ABC transporter ATP-binding protein [Burkholderiales bacterium]|nr:ABC transporter ATP-binding protein [Burkholderiales bacterium]
MVELLAVEGLYKHFGGVVATDRVDFAIAEGEIHALIGPNGAGKTTFVHQLAGALRSDSGRISFGGVEVTHTSFDERVRLGIARSYQITSIFRSHSVLDNVALAVLARSGSAFRFWRALARETALFDEASGIAAQVGLQTKLTQLAGRLPYGEQRRLEVALALATRPKLLLLDEPMAGMDPQATHGIVELVAGLKGKVTVLLVEHDMDAVFKLADRISVLVSGRVIATGAPDEIRVNSEVKRAYLGDEAA